MQTPSIVNMGFLKKLYFNPGLPKNEDPKELGDPVKVENQLNLSKQALDESPNNKNIKGSNEDDDDDEDEDDDEDDLLPKQPGNQNAPAPLN